MRLPRRPLGECCRPPSLYVPLPRPPAPQDALVKIAKKLKKNNVAVDIVSFGCEEENGEKLEAFHAAVNSNDNSHLVTVPPGTILSDMLFGTPIFMEEGAGGGGGGADGGAPAPRSECSRGCWAPAPREPRPRLLLAPGVRSQAVQWAAPARALCRRMLPPCRHARHTRTRAHERTLQATWWMALTMASWEWTPPWTQSWCERAGLPSLPAT